MVSENSFSIPKVNQPDPHSFDFDLVNLLQSVVTVKTRIPDNALTADVLGTEREGHGVVINEQGLVLTIGYIVTEAESVWLIDAKGVTLQGHVVGYDQESGFGLVQALGRLDVPVTELGEPGVIEKGQRMILAGAGGIENCVEVSVASIREFAGYWEYLLNEAYFTIPAHPSWGGAALLGEDGKLYGIGSLIIQTVGQGGNEGAANMVIPVDHLLPIIDELMMYGKRNKPSRPWLGWFVQETSSGLIVAGVVDNGPADKAGIAAGDKVTEINGVSSVTLANMYRSIWASGTAGVEVGIAYERDSLRQSCIVSSVDRNEMLAKANLH